MISFSASLSRLVRSARPTGRKRSPIVLAAVAVLCGFGIAASSVTLVRAMDAYGFFNTFPMPFIDRYVDPLRLRPRYAERRQGAERAPRRSRRTTRHAVIAPPRSRHPGSAVRKTPPVSAKAARAEPAVARRPAQPKMRSRDEAPSISPLATVPGHGGRGTLCVRTCDGFAFPLGVLHSRADLPAHTNACQAACPGADTKLFTTRSGMEDPGSARAASDGLLYRSLKTAFLFRSKTVASCSCQGPDNTAAHLPILLDPTLRAGDVVIDRNGEPKAFAGPVAGSHSPSAFDPVQRSRALSRTAKADVDRLVGPQARRVAAARASERVREASLAPSPRPAAAIPAPRPATASLREVAAPAGSGSAVRAYSLGMGGSSPRIITIP